MIRFTFIFAALIAFATALPVQVRAQAPVATPQATQPSDDEVGNVASV